MPKMSEFEKKVRWYLENIKDTINLEDLEIIEMAQFSTKQRLIFNKKERKLPKKKKKPIKYGDLTDIAKKMDSGWMVFA